MNIPALTEFESDDAIIDLLLRKLEEYKQKPELWLKRGSTTTVNGAQTGNLLELHDDKLDMCLRRIKSQLENLSGAALSYYWAHMIEYDGGGHQELHSHEHNEDLSFVLYLNDCTDGQTRFVLNETRGIEASIVPRRGRGVVFLASLRHLAEFCSTPKRVLVCGLRLA